MYLVAGGRGLAGCGHLLVWLLGLLLLLARSGTRALVCLPCDESKCEEPRSCPGSIVQGVCGCCYMCARQRNESCGGAYGLHGACDRGLRCVIRPPLNGDSITEYEVGVCEGRNGQEINF
ncbi:cysteine-rich motor neuron 1 protein-like [Leptonychotes weddellii]|uniref:Cysteine-rich motor neuron 1 protein-like n=1 Tax=Leptonychotes weddellii TaxID=9713 RepID=A0A7F8Q3B0_LEPWE|nr:cysteine-rich motor neuron 1 protein-like [Leptonychotes weddellii]